MFKKIVLCACALAIITTIAGVSTVIANGINVTAIWNDVAPGAGFARYPGPPNATFNQAYRGTGNPAAALNNVFGQMAVIIEPIAGDDTFAVIIEPIAGDDTFNATLEWLDGQF